MKSLLHLALEILHECGSLCGVCTTLDGRTIERRFEHEGVSFLTISLPAFCRDFEQALDQGRVSDDLFPSYKKAAGGLPHFLGGFLRLVFDHRSGSLLDEPSVDAIFFVRQVTLAFGKIFALPSNKRQLEAMRNYIQTDREVQTDAIALRTALRCHDDSGVVGTGALKRDNSPEPGDGGLRRPDDGWCVRLSDGSAHDPDPVRQVRLRSLLELFQQASLHLFRDALDPIESRAYARGLVGDSAPRHGSGQTAEGILGNPKFAHNCAVWPARLEREFPFLEWVLPNHRHHALLEHVNLLPLAQETPVKVISVPKTMKTSRIIAMEPVAMQYTQQALMRLIVPTLERSRAGAFLGFTDQEPNQLMAVEGSRNGTLATLDLSEASDRVSTLHVQLMLSAWPNLRKMVMACRSRKAEVLGHGVVRLAKYASMGSALTFPLEAMVFLSAIVAAVADARSEPVSPKLIKGLRDWVRVYGDDLIVPVEYAAHVTETLEALGLRVNKSKSFWTGKFRESCGVDAYDGTDVTPVRVRSFMPQSRDDTEEIVSLISTRNQFYMAGFWSTARHLDGVVQRFVPYFPIVEETSPILGRRSVAFEPMAERICPDYQSPLVKGLVIKSVIPRNPWLLPVQELGGVPALMKWFLHSHESCTCLETGCKESHRDPLAVDHLLRSGRPSPVLKTRWRQPF